MNVEEARAQFPVLERYAYLNAGTNGPIARATAERRSVRRAGFERNMVSFKPC